MANNLTDNGLNPFHTDNWKGFVGTSQVHAMPQTLGQYNELQGWSMPENQDPNDLGYLVLLTSVEGTNHPKFGSPITWMTKARFEQEYKADGSMSYSAALILLKNGERICRSGWNGKNMFVELRPGSFTSEVVNSERIDLEHGAYTVLVNLNQKTMSVWVPSPTDHLSEDWSVFKEDF